jgi:hypothetical protein
MQLVSGLGCMPVLPVADQASRSLCIRSSRKTSTQCAKCTNDMFRFGAEGAVVCCAGDVSLHVSLMPGWNLLAHLLCRQIAICWEGIRSCGHCEFASNDS